MNMEWADEHGVAGEGAWVGTWPLRNEVGVIGEVKRGEGRGFRRSSHANFYFCPFCRTPLEGYFGSLRLL
jgi:hypothetical protein